MALVYRTGLKSPCRDRLGYLQTQGVDTHMTYPVQQYSVAQRVASPVLTVNDMVVVTIIKVVDWHLTQGTVPGLTNPQSQAFGITNDLRHPFFP